MFFYKRKISLLLGTLGMAAALFAGTGQRMQLHAAGAADVTGEESSLCGEDSSELSPALIKNMKQLDGKLLGTEEVASFGLDTNTDGILQPGGMPSTGDINTLVVMVDFADVKFDESFTEEHVENLMFGSGDEGSGYYPADSLNAWYERASYGKLGFHGDIKTITLDNTREYYTTSATNPQGLAKYRQEVWTALEDMNIDWSEYDSDGDDYVDALCFMIAGTYGEWGSQWYSHALHDERELDDTYKVGYYVECMEEHCGRSAEVVIHEFAHCLGLPDLYDTSDVENQQSGGIHTSDMMSNNSGDFNALCKMMLGWIDEEQIQVVEYGSDLSTITLDSYPETGSCALLFVDEENASLFGEYYLVQYTDLTANHAGWEWQMENEHLQIFHVNAKLTADGSDFLHDNTSSGDCKLIESVDKDAHVEHGNHKIFKGGTAVYGAFYEDTYDCGYGEGDELTPYSIPASGKYAAAGLSESADVFSGLHVTDIEISGDTASFDVFYEGLEYVGNVNSELLKFEYDEENNYISGEIVVVEWVDGVSTVPSKKPIMTFDAVDGSESIEVFVTATGTNTYYFDRLLAEGLTPGKEYVFNVTSGNEWNVGDYTTVPIYTGTSSIGAEGELGKVGEQIVCYKTDEATGYLLVYGVPATYEGQVNSVLQGVQCVTAENGDNFVSGNIVIVEWVDGVSTVPTKTPEMTFESYDGTECLEVFMKCLDGTNTYYFDRNLTEDMDVSKDYIFRITLTDERNVSEYKSMIATTNYMDEKEGLLWETATQKVMYKTVAADGDNQLRIYAVNK